jgi:hypothetical protein
MPAVLFIVLRAIYIAIRRPTEQMLYWAGGLLGVCLAIWPVAWWSSSMLLEALMQITAFPFGWLLGFLHGDLWYFIPRDMLLGGLNAAYHPITPHIFVERAIINSAAVVWILDWRERRRPKQEVGPLDISVNESEFARPTLL